MSVVSGDSGKTVFCEGKDSSLDYELLKNVIDGLSGITIVPSGGKFGFSIFREGYFSGKDFSKDIVFRDRDFDICPGHDVRLLRLKNRGGNLIAFTTYRACVENYLIDADLIHTYWNERHIEKQENPSAKWGHKHSPGIKAVSDWIEVGARSIKDYQAVRWALSDLMRTTEARVQLKTTWTGRSGILPESLELNDCQSVAIQWINRFRESVREVTADRFENSLAEYQGNNEGFWMQKQYLIWFHGKDIQKAMQRQKQSYISLKDFFVWAVERLDISQHPDIIELRNEIQRL